MSRTLLMAVRGHIARMDRESEPVTVDTDTPGAVVLVLDDGERLELDAVELAAALREAA
jgi:hypothetical protein